MNIKQQKENIKRRYLSKTCPLAKASGVAEKALAVLEQSVFYHEECSMIRAVFAQQHGSKIGRQMDEYSYRLECICNYLTHSTWHKAHTYANSHMYILSVLSEEQRQAVIKREQAATDTGRQATLLAVLLVAKIIELMKDSLVDTPEKFDKKYKEVKNILINWLTMKTQE